MATTAATNRSLDVCPTNVKDALEWLEALESGAQGCANVITQQILGNQNGNLNNVCQELCQKAAEFLSAIKNGGSSYPSTYQRNGWNQLCQTGGSTKCCATNGHGCRNCQGGGQCQGCCKNCPQQICARIFCLIVPVVYSALQCLLQLNGSYNNNRDSIQEYLRALGFNSEGVQQVLQVRQSSRQPQPQPQNGTLASLISALQSATQEIKNALQGSQHSLFDGQSTGGLSISYSSTASQLTTPTSAKDLMLWTIFLPYCSNYGSVQMMLRGSLLSTNGDTSPRAQNGQTYSPLSPFDNLLYGLHVLFIGMDGQGQQLPSPPLPQSSQTIPLRPPSTLFDGINMVCQGLAPYEYYTSTTRVGSSYTDGTDQCCKLLIAGIAIISWAVDMLLQRNGGGGAHGGGIYAYGNGIEQALGFSGNGMGAGGLQQSLGAQIIHYISSALQPIKSAYSSDRFQGLSSYSLSTASPTTPKTPTTFREMLLWLQGLPCSEGYNAVRTLLPNGDSGRSSSKSSSQLNGLATTDPLVEIIFKLPYLFYSLESDNSAGAGSRGTHSNGTMTAYITELFQSQGIDVRRNGAGSPKGPTTGTINVFSYDGGTIKKTFCAIVTVVYYVVDHLKRRYKGAGSSSLSSFGDSSGLLEFLGWDQNTITGALASGYGSNLNGVLQHCFGNGSGTTYSPGANGDHLIQLFTHVRNALSNGSTGSLSSTADSSNSTPSTFRETLLCLVGAPLTQGYDSVKGQLATTASSRPSSSHSSNTVQDHITDTIVGVLQLFHKLEGSILSAVLGVFQNGGGTSVSLKYRYGVTGSTADANSDVVGILCGTTVVMRSVFGFLQQRCNRGAALVGVTADASSANYSWRDCNVTCGVGGGKQTSTTTECQDNNPLCKFLCLLGWNHTKRMGGAGTAAAKTKDTLNGTTFYDLLLKWFGDLASQDQGSSSSSYTYSTSNGDERVLEKLYKYAVQWFQGKTGSATTPSSTTTTSTTPTTPTTIRQMMLWLIGLPLHSVYKALTGNGSKGDNGVIKEKWDSWKSRKSAATDTYTFGASQLTSASDVTNAIVSSSQGMIITMLAIEGSVNSILKYLTGDFLSNNSQGTDSSYGSDPDACFSLLVDYTYKVHYQLRFLLTMCNTGKADGGWKDCEYRNGNASVLSTTSSSAGPLTCKCNGSSSSSCPMPLYNFLLGQGVNHFKNNLKDNQNSAADKNGDQHNLGMGFLNGTHITTSNGKLTGSDIHTYLKYFVNTATEYQSTASNNFSKPFSLLAKYIVALGERGPQSLGDCFELLWQLGNGNLYNYVNGKLKQELKDVTLEVNDGQKNAGTKLISAVQNIIPTTHTDHNDKSLRSLMCTTNTNGGTCAPYMESLSQGLYHYYCPEIDESDPEKNQFTILQYIYDMLKKLVDKMKELKKAFDECPCCKSSGSTDCQGLIQCQYAHPILYKFGFVFGNPGTLKSGDKKCDTLKTQLDVVLSCTKNSESTLFSAFECVIQVTYKVLLERAKACVTKKYPTNNGNGNTTASGLKSTNQEMNTAFTPYFHNAMYESYPKLLCTFACKVFDDKHNCESSNCETRFKSMIKSPTNIIPDPNSSSTTLQVTKSNVPSISAIIPEYTAPPIDPYHYRTFNKSITKAGGSASAPGNSTSYSFKDAIAFHVSGANCITPMPVALRSVIDWILRVTVGSTENNNSNGNISKLSEAIKSVLKDSGVNVTDNVNVQSHLTDLVSGLRKFMGYQDRSDEVKTSVTTVLGNGANGTNGVKGELEKKIDKLNKFIGTAGKDSFASELGKALLKGRYKKNGNGDKKLRELIKELQGKLKEENNDSCELKCNTLNNSAAASQGGDQNDGLQILKDLFSAILNFAAYRDDITKGHDMTVLNQLGKAERDVKGPNLRVEYFSIVLQALVDIGNCYKRVKELITMNGSISNSSEYRTKISALKEALQAAIEELTEKDGDNGSKADVRCAVSAATALIKKTKERTEAEITEHITMGLKNHYDNHNKTNNKIIIKKIIASVEGALRSYMTQYQSHLDDLKRLCQWLYRMGQLYAHGLKGFVESLVKHLEHIITVIKWIEGIEKMIKKLKEISQEDGVAQTISDFNDIKNCCQTHNGLYNSTKFTSRDNFFTALNCRINNLLGSYVLEDSEDATDDDSSTRCHLLLELRLLALDRYTLQVWQDNKDNIKNWITFEKGIVKHSDLEAIKEKLHDLTGIDYSSNNPTAHSPTNRIHNFHAICVIQKFSYEAPIARLERSLEKLKEIQGQLSAVKERCNGSTTNVSTVQEVQTFCKLVTEFLSDPYGIYNFAKFVHTILGPNVFSAVIVALEELEDNEKYKPKTQNGGNLDKIKGILEVLVDGNTMDSERQNDYKLEELIKKLQTFITTLRKEYIFEYPPFDWTKCCKDNNNSAGANRARRSTSPESSLPAPNTCTTCPGDMSKIFVGFVPQMYRLFKMLREMTKEDGYGRQHKLEYDHNGRDKTKNTMSSLAGILSREGWRVYDEKTKHDQTFELDHEKTGEKVCELLKEIIGDKEPGALVSSSTSDSMQTDLKPLERLFKAVMQHFKKKRRTLREQREDELKKEFDKNPNNKGIPFQAPPPVLPSTVRQVLFWLHEMETEKAFYDGMSEHIDKLCQRSSIDIKHDTILHVLKLSASQAMEVLATIEDPGKQHPTYLYDLYTEEHYYAYPTVNIPLFFYTFVEKLMAAFLELNFVCVQCRFTGKQGGWSECHIGNAQASQGDDTTKEALCKCGSQSPPNSASNSCPRPLYSFLFDNKTDLKIPSDVSQRLVYMSKGTMPCGFQLKNSASTDGAQNITPTTPLSTSMTGSVLVEPLRKLVGGHVKIRLTKPQQSSLNNVIYLRDLLRYVLCLAVRPPWSMSENMAFFYRVTEAWKQKGAGSVALKNQTLLGSIKHEIDLFPGTFDGERLTTAVERFAGIEDTEHKKTNGTHSNTSHQYDLRTLMGCKEMNSTKSSGTTAQCSTFMFPLSLDVYTHYDHRNSRAYLSWILNFAFAIYGQLRGLQEMMQERNCMMNTSSSMSDCASLPTCPGVLTALYQSGSSFMDQGKLAEKKNGNKKTCAQFRDVLSGLFNCDSTYCSPLHNLIVQCEAFLWSIRLPFSLVQLSLWSVAVLFISYVFVVPLDHFKIKSHLFNRLKYTMHPSLLIADQQRRVSELAYFSL